MSLGSRIQQLNVDIVTDGLAALAGCSPRPGLYTTYRLSTFELVTVQNVVRANLKDPAQRSSGR